MRTLILLVGPPASGKSYWAHYAGSHLSCVSRDAIRFSFLEDKDDYFAFEKDVFKEFVHEINNNGEDGSDIIADATHISLQSRAKVLKQINWNYFDSLRVEVFDCPLEVALERNSKRSGRARVPNSAIEQDV